MGRHQNLLERLGKFAQTMRSRDERAELQSFFLTSR